MEPHFEVMVQFDILLRSLWFQQNKIHDVKPEFEREKKSKTTIFSRNSACIISLKLRIYSFEGEFEKNMINLLINEIFFSNCHVCKFHNH